jgi:adenylyl-sulfate kinase
VDIRPHQHTVSHADRVELKPHRPACLWFTGLSGSGKSTIANSVELRLNREFKAHTYLLDGDNIRGGLNSDLGFSLQDRQENIRRLGEVAKLFVDAGLIVLTAFISPLRADRDQARRIIQTGHFIEVFVECPIEICERRDPKGLYYKARQGLIPDFTGISSPYEPPDNPELVLHSSDVPVDSCVSNVIYYLLHTGIL